ncbi:MAG: AAA family ATPase [Parvibaculum sp.]|uniref:AAA family ATPase n=1 Tax=Parvibaculum sp. TaxID=2024848 RepID=UPI002ABA2FD0|nr:AAA family ATPase [Parvibaculum sp.]MDZ4380198.1 AAA family ATPase [Parvibaculum sp.]
MALQEVETPIFWIVAGPNGSGKSTLYGNTDIEGFGRSVWIINPDLLTVRLREKERLNILEANGEALNRIQAWLEASINAHQTVGVETVLSTGKYRPLVEKAKSLGFEIRLLYVTLQNASLNIERVRMRVAAGGHDVPEDKIIERRERSFRQLAWFLEQADMALIFDNSGISPTLVGRKVKGVVTIDPNAPREIINAAQNPDG